MSYRVCTRCIVDTSLPGARFDERGECSYCKIHDRLERQYPLTADGERQLERLVDRIKAEGRGRRYDCIVGVSGGRDSTYTLWLTRQFGLRPLCVHFNDGFGNPVAGENMTRAAAMLGADLRTVTSDWRESKDLKIAFLRSSTPDLEQGTDIGIYTALLGSAAKENVRYIISGFSFRTEGICPLPWNYLDGVYLRAVHRRFGTVPLRPWTPHDPGFNLELPHLFYYTMLKRIRVIPLLSYVNYVRPEAEAIIARDSGWVYPGSKYYDDLYQSLMAYVLRVKFGIDRRRFLDSALVRSGQLTREQALKGVEERDSLENTEVIDLCVKRLGLSRPEFDELMRQPPKTFRDYPNGYRYVRALKPGVWLLSRLKILPAFTYDKYFECG